MTSGWRNGWDLLAAIAAVIALIMIGLYIGLISQQGGQVAAWFLAGLAAAALLSIYGVAHGAPRRGLALAVSGGVMAVLGLLSILSIGFQSSARVCWPWSLLRAATAMARSPAE